MTNIKKKKLLMFIVGAGSATVLFNMAGADTVPIERKVSYERVKYDNLSGDTLTNGQYALFPRKTHWYRQDLRARPGDEPERYENYKVEQSGNFWDESLSATTTRTWMEWATTSPPFNTLGMTEISATFEYFSEYINPNTSKVETYPITADDYKEDTKGNPPKRDYTTAMRWFKRAFAAIAFDATSNSGTQANVSSFTFSHTTSGSDRVLYVGVSMQDTTDADKDVTAITYSGIPLVLSQRQNISGTSKPATEQGYLIHPPTGSHTVSVTLAGSNTNAAGGASSYTGVHQKDPIDNTSGVTEASATSHTHTHTTNVANTMIAEVISTPGLNASDCAQDNGQTEDWDVLMTAARGCGAGAHLAVATASSQSLGWSGAGTNPDWAHSVISFAPAPTFDVSVYKKKRELTINPGGTSGGAATTTSGGVVIPNLATTTLTDLTATSTSGDLYCSGLQDLVFTDSSDNLLAFDIVSTSTLSDGVLEAWFSSGVSSTTATTVNMYYSDDSETCNDFERTVQVYDYDYLAYWHFNEDPSISTDGDCGGGTSEVCDSTNYNNDGDSVGSMTSDDLVSGQVGLSLDFDGTDDVIDIPASSLIDPGTGDFSISMWINRDSGNNGELINYNVRNDVQLDLRFNSLILSKINDGTTSVTSTADGDAVPADVWSFLTVTFDRDGDMIRYLNGGATGTKDDISAVTGDISGTAWDISFAATPFGGGMDDVRIHNQALHPMDILTDYHMSVDNTTYLTIGAEEDVGVTANTEFTGQVIVRDILEVRDILIIQ